MDKIFTALLQYRVLRKPGIPLSIAWASAMSEWKLAVGAPSILVLGLLYVRLARLSLPLSQGERTMFVLFGGAVGYCIHLWAEARFQRFQNGFALDGTVSMRQHSRTVWAFRIVSFGATVVLGYGVILLGQELRIPAGVP